MKLRATITVEYTADHGDYQSYDPQECAEIDQANWQEDPGMFFASFKPDEYTVEVAPVESIKPAKTGEHA